VRFLINRRMALKIQARRAGKFVPHRNMATLPHL